MKKEIKEMAEQRFVNLMDNGSGVIGRKSGILNKIVIDSDVTPNTSVRIYQDFGRMEIRVVREENYQEDPQHLNPFDDWVVNNENNEMVVWIVTPRLGMVHTIKNTMKVLQVDGGFLVALLKGKIAVENADGEKLEIQRWYGGSAEVEIMNTPTQFQPFGLRKVVKGFELPHYGWNVLFDITMKQHVYGEKNGFRYEDSEIRGIDFRPTDFHKLDADVYEEQVNQYLEMKVLEKEKQEQLRAERLKADEKLVAERIKKQQEALAAENEKKVTRRGSNTGGKAGWSEQSKEILERMGISV